MPKSMNPVAVELRIKYLSADSRAVLRSTMPHRQYSASESNSRPRKIVIRFAAPAISMAPHVLHSIKAVVPAMRSLGPIAPYRISEPSSASNTISSNTLVKPPVMKPPKNAL